MTIRSKRLRARSTYVIALGAAWFISASSCGGDDSSGSGGATTGGSAGAPTGGAGPDGAAGSDTSLGGASGAGAVGGAAGAGGAGAGGTAGLAGSAGADAAPGDGGPDSATDASEDSSDDAADSTSDALAGDACVPQPCANDNVTCGEVPDGCGGTSKCIHTCAAPETCGAKAPNKCGCAEYTAAEIATLCAGKCAVAAKCNPTGVFDCSSYSGSCSADGPYDVCDGSKTYSTSPLPTGDCLICSRPFATDDCSYGSGKPFKYYCAYGAECTQGSDCKSGTCGSGGVCYCNSGTDCKTGACDSNTHQCLGYYVNNLQDVEETDVDCGGPKNPVKCAPGKKCLQDSDCEGATSGSCQGGVPPSTYGTCLNSGGPKVGCSKYGGNAMCCYESLGGFYPYNDSTAVSFCAGKGLPFVFRKDSGPSTAPDPGCVAGAGWWCCPDEQFL